LRPAGHGQLATGHGLQSCVFHLIFSQHCFNFSARLDPESWVLRLHLSVGTGGGKRGMQSTFQRTQLRPLFHSQCWISLCNFYGVIEAVWFICFAKFKKKHSSTKVEKTAYRKLKGLRLFHLLNSGFLEQFGESTSAYANVFATSNEIVV